MKSLLQHRGLSCYLQYWPSIWAPVQGLAASLPIQLAANTPGNKMLQVFGPLPFTWKMWIKFLAPRFILSHPWPLQLFEEWIPRWKISISLCLSLSFCQSAFQINKTYCKKRKQRRDKGAKRHGKDTRKDGHQEKSTLSSPWSWVSTFQSWKETATNAFKVCDIVLMADRAKGKIQSSPGVLKTRPRHSNWKWWVDGCY